MPLIPERRRRLRVQDPERRPKEEPREVDLHHVHLARPARPQVPAVVVGLLGFLAGAIMLQSLLGGVLGLIVALLLRTVLEKAL